MGGFHCNKFPFGIGTGRLCNERRKGDDAAFPLVWSTRKIDSKLTSAGRQVALHGTLLTGVLGWVL